MGLTWTPWALPGLLAIPAAWTAAIVVFRTAPHRSLNRRLAFLLLLEGCWIGGTAFFLVEDPSLAFALATVAMAAMSALPFQYLAFLGVALDTPLVAPFRSRIAFWILALGSAGVATWVLLSPSTFAGELYSPSWATWNFYFRPAGQRAAQVVGAVSLFGLAAAVHAYRRARPGTAARIRARWFAIAFGLWDAYTGTTLVLYGVLRDLPFWGDFIYNPGQTTIYLIFVLLLAYGVLHTQLFDIDLKLKLALRQSTVGAFFAVAFFVGSEVLERFIPVDGVVLGLLVSGAIVLALRPIQRFAEGVSNHLMGGVLETQEYLRDRKHLVYRAALEGAVEDETVTRRERAILDRLREELGIPDAVARKLEREVLVTGSPA